MATNATASFPDMPITIKIIISGKDENRKFKLPLKDLGANSLPDKVRNSGSLAFTITAALTPTSLYYEHSPGVDVR